MASCAEGLRRRRSTSLRINFLSAVSPSSALLSVRVRVRVRVKLRLRVKIRLRVSLRVYSVTDWPKLRTMLSGTNTLTACDRMELYYVLSQK